LRATFRNPRASTLVAWSCRGSSPANVSRDDDGAARLLGKADDTPFVSPKLLEKDLGEADFWKRFTGLFRMNGRRGSRQHRRTMPAECEWTVLRRYYRALGRACLNLRVRRGDGREPHASRARGKKPTPGTVFATRSRPSGRWGCRHWTKRRQRLSDAGASCRDEVGAMLARPQTNGLHPYRRARQLMTLAEYGDAQVVNFSGPDL